MAQLVAKTYAEALMEVAVESGHILDFKRELGFVAETLAENPDFNALFMSPSVGIDEKKSVMEAVFGKNISPSLLNFVKILTDKGREHDLVEIKSEFDAMVDAHEGVVKGRAVSSVPMTEAQIKALEEKLSTLSGIKVTLVNVVDDSIVGGVVLEIGDKMIDGSIRKQLAQIKEELRQVIV